MTVEKKSVQTIHHRRCFSGFATIFALAESDDLQLSTLAMLPALESREPSAGRSVLRLDLQQNASYFSGLGAERKFSQEGAASLEAYLSTQPAAPGQDARVSRADGDSRRPPDLEAPAAKGPPSPHPMMGGCAPQAFP